MNDEIEQAVAKKLVELAKENPDLPIIIMVSNEANGGDEWCYWLNRMSSCRVVEFYTDGDFGEGRVYFRDQDLEDLEMEVMDRVILNEDLSEAEQEVALEAYMDKLEWVKAIVVYVEPY